jgi:hypothetical protein
MVAKKDPILTKHGKSLAKVIGSMVAHHKAKASGMMPKKPKRSMSPAKKRKVSKGAKAKKPKHPTHHG